MWFKALTGFEEESPQQVQEHIELDGERLRSKVNGQTYVFGRLTMPSLGELRAQLKAVSSQGEEKLRLQELVANIQNVHLDPANEGAFFQAASQFNLLEMVGPSVTPEAGIGIYERDRTQGPACAIAAGAGTIYRNYFVPLEQQIGQSSQRQIDCLKDIGLALGNENDALWAMKNGYALATREGLEKIADQLNSMTELEKDALRARLRIGVQWDTQVTLQGAKHLVSQAYCSALPVAYSNQAPALWTDFAQLVLEASYEACLMASVLNFSKTGNNKVYLTLLGGGAFGNDENWIFAAIERALDKMRDFPLEVYIVSYGYSNPAIENRLSAWM